MKALEVKHEIELKRCESEIRNQFGGASSKEEGAVAASTPVLDSSVIQATSPETAKEKYLAGLRQALQSTMEALKAQEVAVEASNRERERCLRRVAASTEARVRAEVEAANNAKLEVLVREAAEAARAECLEGECASLLFAQRQRDAAKFEAERSAAVGAVRAAHKRALSLHAEEAAAELSLAQHAAKSGDADAHALALEACRCEAAREAVEDACAVAEAEKEQALTELKTAHEGALRELLEAHELELKGREREHSLKLKGELATLSLSYREEVSLSVETTRHEFEASQAALLAEQGKFLEEELEQQRLGLEAKHEENSKHACAESASEAVKLALTQARAQFELELIDLRASHASHVSELEAAHAQASVELKREHCEEVRTLYESRRELTSCLQAELSDAREEARVFKEELRATKERLATELGNARAASEAHEKAVVLSSELAKLTQDALRSELSVASERVTTCDAQWRQRHQAEVQALEARHAAGTAHTLATLGQAHAQALARSSEECSLARKLYLEERAQRMVLHERVMELQGNIRVFARCRPSISKLDDDPSNTLLLEHDPSNGGTGMTSLSVGKGSPVEVWAHDGEAGVAERGFGEALVVRDCRGYDTKQRLRFDFDACFGPRATQDQVFESMRPLVTSFLDGFSVCVFAYGQTGSGKTYTMDGNRHSTLAATSPKKAPCPSPPRGRERAGSEDQDDDDDPAGKVAPKENKEKAQAEAQAKAVEVDAEVVVDLGINGRTVREAFSVAALRCEAAPDDSEFAFEVEYLEVYNETVRDLLASSSTEGSGSSGSAEKQQANPTAAAAAVLRPLNPQNLEIRQAQDGRVMVPGVTRVRIRSEAELAPLLALGASRRHTESHKVNDRSSRSHAILTLICTSTCSEVKTRQFNFNNFNNGGGCSRSVVRDNGDDDDDEYDDEGDVMAAAAAAAKRKKKTKKVTTVSRLHLVDLAGSERVAKTEAVGERLKEANAINKSLAALGDVITALTSKKAESVSKKACPAEQPHGGPAASFPPPPPSSTQSNKQQPRKHHIPFRNSKLTFLLQDSLVGSSKVLMICAVAPTPRHVGETICSLNFACRCRAVQLGGGGADGGKGGSGGAAVRRLEARVRELELELEGGSELEDGDDDHHPRSPPPAAKSGSSSRVSERQKASLVGSRSNKSGFVYAHGGSARDKENGVAKKGLSGGGVTGGFDSKLPVSPARRRGVGV